MEKMRNMQSMLDKQIEDNNKNKRPVLEENGNLKFICQHGQTLYPCDKCNKLFPSNLLHQVNGKHHKKKRFEF